jgi:zinc protease
MNALGATVALALVLAANAAAAQAQAVQGTAAVAVTDLVPDPDVRFGVLPNGMRYQIRKNATPPNNASLRMRIDTGSMYEADDQRGLAHFIEHMAFNGSKNVPEGEFIKRLERAGLKFGPDTNASTGFDETIYMLDLPKTDASTVDTALFLLREAAGEISFAPDAIDRERGIILSEERTRANPQLRSYEDEVAYMLKGDIIASRMPIGLPEVISKAPRERFTAFYDAYYRPERTTLIAVGDFDVDKMEADIRKLFGTWAARGKAGPELPAPKLAQGPAQAHVYVEPGLPNRVSLAWVSPPDVRPDTRAVRAERLLPQLGLRVLTRRLERIAATPEAPFVFGGAFLREQMDRAEIAQVVAIAKDGKTREALALLDQEQRRAAQFGFSQAELDREITEIRTALTAAATGAATRPTPVLANAMVGAVNRDDVLQAPAKDLADFEAAVRGLKAEQAASATAKLFTGNPYVYATAPAPLEGGGPALLAAYTASAKTPVTAGAVKQAAAWPYESFGSPGKVVERKELPSIGATAIRFANGVRLTVKPTDFRKDEVLVSARLGNGLLAETDHAARFLLSSGAFGLGGLGKMTYEDQQEALATRVASANFGIGEDAFVLSGRTRPADLATQLQLLAAYATDPGLRPSGFDRLRSLGGTIHDQLESTPSGVFQRESGALLRSGDPRFAIPSRAQIAAAKIEQARAFANGPYRNGPLEIVMVGDVTVDEAVKQVAATFGSLPARRAETPAPASLRSTFPAGGLVKAVHKGRADQGLAFIAWPTTDFYADQKKSRTLNLLSQVLQLRLIAEIREKQATTYSPGATHTPSRTFRGYGYMAAQIEAPPEKLDTFLADAAKIAAELRDKPITDDELQRARKPLVEGIIRQRAANNWWLNELAGAQTRPEVVTSISDGLAQYETITAADLQKAAGEYLVDAKAWKMQILPAPQAGATAAAPAG